ncbi:hypothetical protein MHZ92_11745 [Sporosarcina sp. ACRSL]|uniref:hypothetical protein n=1 Tax=Sporosarcina sp. ACRSL TaxID=2918215 RepID=UPI001EF4C060|nr:hypothetical protein [Sporosarcina sp. ACRSL]MCG7344809.1 hypothetical protein [Sporosarcina sp. ACRSL]
MNRSKFLLELKEIMRSEEGCTTKTTVKKKEGFVPYNRHGIKWGQVDANNEKHVRVVFDLSPGFLDEKEFAHNTGLSVTPPRKITTGYRFTKKYKVDGHDQLILFLEDSFLEGDGNVVQAVFDYAKEFTATSGFKAHPSR